MDNFAAIQTADEEKIAEWVVGQAFGDQILFLDGVRKAGASDGGKISVDLLHEFDEIVGILERGKCRVSIGVETFFQGDAFRQAGHGCALLEKLRVRFGQEIQDCAAVGSFAEKIFSDGHLRADFGSIGGLNSGTADFFLFLCGDPA